MSDPFDNPLIRQLYEKREQNFKDIRHLYTDTAMTKRIDELRRMIRQVPLHKKTNENTKYKRWCIEFRLLQWKRILYRDTTPSMIMVKWRLQLSDRHSWEEPESVEQAQERKKEHLLVLLNIDLCKKSDEELQNMLDMIDIQ